MRIFITGAHGQVARSLREAASGDPRFVVGQAARPEFDLAQPDTILPILRDFAPDLVINPAAYTAVDKAETETDAAFAVNRDGAGAVAAAAAALGAPVIHLSTDYVFDGLKDDFYTESDPVGPRSVYGHSKLAGELAVAAANPQHIILRTAWVYAPFGGNFVRTMVRLAGQNERLRVVADQVGCPTYAPDIAAAILTIADRIAGQGWASDYAGVTHLAGPDALSWCDFARAIVTGVAERGGRSIPVDAITTKDYPTPAARPANSRLATARLNQVFGVTLPPMSSSLSRCLDQLLEVSAPSQGNAS